MVKTAVTATKAKFKVGEYVVARQRVFLEVLGVIDGVQPVYALQSPKSTQPHWKTEFEIFDESPDAHAEVPDFARYAKLKAGDMLHMGDNLEDEYTTILARVGDMCLISMAPHKHEIKQVNKLADQIKELTDGEVDVMAALDDETTAKLKKHGSSNWAKNVADEWKSTKWLCLMNWAIVEQEG